MTDQIKEANPFEGWVTVQEAARIVGRQDSVIRYWVQKGYIKAHLVGRRTKVVNVEQVRAYSEKHLPHESDS